MGIILNIKTRNFRFGFPVAEKEDYFMIPEGESYNTNPNQNEF